MSNDESRGPGSLFSDLLRLQTEFQARLTEETLNYLRRLQGAAAPAAPGTVLRPEEGTVVSGSGAPGEPVTLALEVENRQRLHTVVTPMLGPLVNGDGVTWFPSTERSPGSMLVPPGQVRDLQLAVRLPAGLPAGTYRGPLLLQGFGDGALAVAIEVASPEAQPPPAPEPPPAKTGEPAPSSSAARRRTRRRRGADTEHAGEQAREPTLDQAPEAPAEPTAEPAPAARPARRRRSPRRE